MKFERRFPPTAAILVFVMWNSCDESLPPYRDPLDALTGSVRGRYTHSAIENNVKIDVIIINSFDETFEAEGILEGRGSITLQSDPAFVKTFSITPSLWTAGKYNPVTGNLRMDPGDSLRFMYTWDLIDDRGENLREAAFRYAADPTCSLRFISREEQFILRAGVKVFEKIQEIEAGPSIFSLCYISRWVPPNVCPSILVDEPKTYCP